MIESVKLSKSSAISDEPSTSSLRNILWYKIHVKKKMLKGDLLACFQDLEHISDPRFTSMQTDLQKEFPKNARLQDFMTSQEGFTIEVTPLGGDLLAVIFCKVMVIKQSRALYRKT
ncbi:hypothetical protein Tco_0671221 [Tanacetum coccineum]